MSDRTPTALDEAASRLYNAVVQPETIWYDDLTPEMQAGWRRGVAEARAEGHFPEEPDSGPPGIRCSCGADWGPLGCEALEDQTLWGDDGPAVGQVITIAGTSTQTRWTGTRWVLAEPRAEGDWIVGHLALAERMHEVWVLSGRPDPFAHDMEAWRGFALAVRAALEEPTP